MTTIATATTEENDLFQPSTAAYAGYKVGEDFWGNPISFTNKEVYDAFWMDLPDGLDPDGDDFYKEVCYTYFSDDGEGAAFTHYLATATQTESCFDFDNYDKAQGYANAISDQSYERDERGWMFYWNTKKNPFGQALEVFRSLITENKEFACVRTYEEQMAMHKEWCDKL